MLCYRICRVILDFFFFFKQKTAYEIYQCDWSSDVCSSDLNISKSVLAKGLDAGTAFEILSIDIADVDVGENIEIGRASCRERV